MPSKEYLKKKEERFKNLLNGYINGQDGLYHFAEDILSGFLKKPSPEFHREIYTLLRNALRLVLAAPRSFAKTTIICVIYAIYAAVFKLRRDIVIISASEGHSVEQLRKIKRNFQSNGKLTALYYKIYGKMPTSPKWSESHIILSNGVNIRAKGAEAQIRGFRPDLFLLDDIETDEGVRSEDRRKHLKEWFERAVIGTLDPNAQLVLIGTVLHHLSLLSHLLEDDSKKSWERRLYRAYTGPEEKGYELWPEKWPHEELQKRKAEIGSFAFSAEYMNNPVPEDAAAFKKEYLRYYDNPPPLSMVQVFDPAYTEDVSSDYKVSAVIGKDAQGTRYLIEYIRTHRPMGDFLNESVNLYKRHRPQKVGIPTGSEKLFFNTAQEMFRDAKCYPIFEEIKNTFGGHRKKEQRIVAALQGLFQSGRYYIKKAHQEAIEELLTFPAGKHDDILDCLAGAEQIIENTYIDTPEQQEYARTQHTRRGVTGYGEY